MEMMQEKAVKRKAPSTAQDDAAGATPAEPSTSQHPAADDEGHLTEIADDSVEKELMDVDWQARPLLQYTVTRTQSVMWLVVVMLRVVNAMRPYVHVQAHPAETIVAETYHAKVLILLCACMQTCAGDNFYSACMLELSRKDSHCHVAGCSLQYLVKRKGLDFSACGMVDAKAAKRQRLMAPTDDNQTESAACPVTVPMMDEWDAFNRSFRCAVHAHSDSGELDLGKSTTPFEKNDRCA